MKCHDAPWLPLMVRSSNSPGGSTPGHCAGRRSPDDTLTCLAAALPAPHDTRERNSRRAGAARVYL